MTNHTTREAWLLAAVELLRPVFKDKQHIIPNNCQVSCGFASTGSKHHIGQCWSRKSSVHDCTQIFVSPALLDPILVLDTLVHELVHAVDDCEHKHGKEFKKIALSLGMIGPMRSAGAGPVLEAKLAELSSQLGPYFMAVCTSLSAYPNAHRVRAPNAKHVALKYPCTKSS